MQEINLDELSRKLSRMLNGNGYTEDNRLAKSIMLATFPKLGEFILKQKIRTANFGNGNNITARWVAVSEIARITGLDLYPMTDRALKPELAFTEDMFPEGGEEGVWIINRKKKE